MGVSQLGDYLAKVLPTVRTKLQLSGLAVILGAWVLVEFAQPGKTDAMLTGGAIGVSMIIFGQLFHFLRFFPEGSRALVFLGSFGMFCVLVISLLIITIFLLRQPSMDVTLEAEEGGVIQSGKVVGTKQIISGSQSAHTTYKLPVLPDIFLADEDDEKLRHDAAEFGTGVYYNVAEKDNVIEVNASMPYLRKMRGEGYIVPMTVDRFMWLPPVLSFKVSNPRSQPLLITQAKIEASSLVNEDEPILIVSDAKPYRKPSSSGDSSIYYPLSFYNVSWGVVHEPVLRFSIVRDAEVEKATQAPYQHTVKMEQFDGKLELDLTNYLDAKMKREQMEPELALGELLKRSGAVNFSGGSILEYLNVIGQLAFKTERGEEGLVNFRAKIYFSGFGPGRINPSYKYNVYLPGDVRDFPIIVPLSQCISGYSADNFLMAFNSPRSVRYELTVKLHSSDGVMLSKRMVIHTMVSRNYGLASPRKVNYFSVRQGCT